MAQIDGRHRCRPCSAASPVGWPGSALAAPGPAAVAGIFAPSDEAVITDPAGPRMGDRFGEFATEVDHFIRAGGDDPVSSRVVNGVFYSPNCTTRHSSGPATSRSPV
jgi:hypothetical protein